MSQLLTKIQDDFTGGLFKRFGSYLAPPNTASKLQNARVDKGGFRKIGGHTYTNSTGAGIASAVTTLYRAYIGSKSISIMTAAADMYYWKTSDGSWQSFKSGLALNSPWSFVTYNGYIYGCNGVDNYMKIDVSSFSTSSAPTITEISAAGACPPVKSKVLFTARERLWAVGNSTSPDRGYYCSKDASGVGLPETWSADKYLAFPRQSANFGVIGGIDWRDQPVILTERTTSLVLGDNNMEFEQPIMDNSIGCAARRSICSWGDVVIFLSWNGVYVFGGGKCRCISLNIQDYIDDINPTYISNAVAITDENCYYLSYTSTAAGGTINNRTLIFDTRIGDVVGGVIKGGWTGPHTIGAGAFMRYFGAGDNGELYFGDASPTGLVYKFMDDTKTSFNGGSIDMDVETENYDYSEVVRPDIKRQIKKVIVMAEPQASGGNISASYYNDNVSSDVFIDTVSLATVGKERGDMTGQTSATRTFINHPLIVKPETSSICYFNRLRFRCNDAVSQCKVIKVIQTAELREDPATT